MIERKNRNWTASFTAKHISFQELFKVNHVVTNTWSGSVGVASQVGDLPPEGRPDGLTLHFQLSRQHGCQGASPAAEQALDEAGESMERRMMKK